MVQWWRSLNTPITMLNLSCMVYSELNTLLEYIFLVNSLIERIFSVFIVHYKRLLINLIMLL